MKKYVMISLGVISLTAFAMETGRKPAQLLVSPTTLPNPQHRDWAERAGMWCCGNSITRFLTKWLPVSHYRDDEVASPCCNCCYVTAGALMVGVAKNIVEDGELTCSGCCKSVCYTMGPPAAAAALELYVVAKQQKRQKAVWEATNEKKS